MKNKKQLLAIVLAITAQAAVWAQGQPVIDITSIYTAVQNGSVMVQQLQTMYANLQASYDQLQQQIKSYEPFDIKNLSANDPFGASSLINTYADRVSAYKQNIGSLLNNKDIKIAGGSYSLADVFSAPTKTAQSIAANAAQFVLDPLEERLTLEERTIFHQLHGMSFGNYTRIHEFSDRIRNKSAEITAYIDNLQTHLEEDSEYLTSLKEKVFGNGSIVQQQQVANSIATVMAQDIKTQSQILGDIANQFSMMSNHAMTQKQIMEEEINTNAMGISEGLIKMLKETSPINLFK